MEFSQSHKENVALLSNRLRSAESFDIIERHLSVAGEDVCFFYVDGFVKDAELQRLMQFLLSRESLSGAKELVEILPYVEVERAEGTEKTVISVLSGQTALISSAFPGEAILIDARTYPARSTAEPDTDRVMQGSRDGFVETLIFNTAMIRRRIRDTNLTMHYASIGTRSKTDVVLCYIKGIADEKYVQKLSQKLERNDRQGYQKGEAKLSKCQRRGAQETSAKVYKDYLHRGDQRDDGDKRLVFPQSCCEYQSVCTGVEAMEY